MKPGGASISGKGGGTARGLRDAQRREMRGKRDARLGRAWRAPPPVANSRLNARLAPIAVGSPPPKIGSPPYRAPSVGDSVGEIATAFWKLSNFRAIGW